MRIRLRSEKLSSRTGVSGKTPNRRENPLISPTAGKKGGCLGKMLLMKKGWERKKLNFTSEKKTLSGRGGEG